MQRRKVIQSILTAGLGVGHLPTFAQSATWPTKPVRLVVPWAAGGAADVLARAVSQKLSEMWGQQVVVDNKPGGNTIIAAVEVKRAAPDGYTLFQPIGGTLTFNPFVYSKLPYQPTVDFTPIAALADVALVVLASKTSGFKTLQEMIVQAKLKPDTVTIGTGSGLQTQSEQWMRDWGVKLKSVFYKSGVDISRAVVAGEIDLGLDGIVNNQQYIVTNRVQGLAVNISSRHPAIPNVPTLNELQVGNKAPPIWHGWVAPAGLPVDLQNKISNDLKTVLSQPDMKERLAGLGFEVSWMPPQQLTARIQSESQLVSRLVKEVGIKLD